MSANNWCECPKCMRESQDSRILKLQKAEYAYGKVPPEQYMEMRTEAENRVAGEQTLREDYYQGMAVDGTYFVEYSCSCDKCGFNFKYNYSKKVKL